MFDFNSNNKLSGVYWLKQPIDDLKLQIKIKPKASAINLPKYEEFMNISTTADLDKIESDGIDEHVFKWQEKVFSVWEIKTYSDVHNCGTETQLDHHNALNTKEYKPQKVFTYIHQDYYLPVPLDLNKSPYQRSNFNLLSCFEDLSLTDRFRSFGGSSSQHQLFHSQESVIEKSSWISMHVVFDDSAYTTDSQLLIKQEYILLSLYYNITGNYLIISPDVNNLVQNPYNVSTENCSANFEYGVEIIFDESESDQDLVNLLDKLYIKWQKKHKQMVKFIPAPTGKEKFYVNIEIVSANDFDMDNIYIEYEIKIPENFKCEDILRGRTHISKATNNGDRFWTYGQIIEFDIEIDEEIELSPLQLYLEAISSDWWGRQRTEGYCYLPLSLIPGCYNKVLTCSRPEEIDKVEANTRRFFVGGCHLIKDLGVFSKPQLQNTDFTFTETGNIHLRYSIIRQVNSSVEMAADSRSSASALLQRTELVLREYSRAAARLAAATKHIDCAYT